MIASAPASTWRKLTLGIEARRDQLGFVEVTVA
jgi:hypothetical protein